MAARTNRKSQIRRRTPVEARRGFTLIVLVAILVASSFAPADEPDLDRGHQTLLTRGLQIHATTFVPRTGYFDTARWAESNFTTIGMLYYPYTTDGLMPSSPPGIPWARWLWTWNGVDETDIQPSEQPYVSNLIRLQLKDERDITDPTELAYLASTTANLHTLYPNVIVHTNQWGSQFSVQQMQDYMQQVQPDMLMFDTYPFNGNVAGGSPTNLYRDLEKYRKLGLAGNDGTGARPIPVGMYTQTFNYKVTESEIRLNNFSAWAFGYKLVDSFVYDDPQNPDLLPVLFTPGTGTTSPTAQFYQVAETNRQSLNIGDALVRLISTDVRMKMGQHKVLTFNVDNGQPDGVSSWNASADPYITNITATNLGSKNDSLPGDVIVGYFKPLDASFTDPGHEDDLYFMIVNGLSDEAGSAYDCRQLISMDFNFGGSGITQLLRMSRDTGEVEEVALTHDGGTLYHLDLTLYGGEGDLFKFDNGGEFVPEPATIALLLSGSLMLSIRKKRADRGR